MKKYRLIREYPGSPKLGYVIGNTEGTNMYFYNGLQITDPDKYSEFWEEIIEYPVGTKVIDTTPQTMGCIYEKLRNGKWKIGNMDYFTIPDSSIGKGKRFELVETANKNYHILSFTDVLGKYDILKLWPNGLYGIRFGEYTLEDQLKKLKEPGTAKTIHSIKSLSNGEVFQIGDSVEYYGKYTTLESIYYNEHNQLSFKVEGIGAPLTGCFMVNHPHFKKVKPKPLFTTEDGVDVFKGDSAIALDPINFKTFAETTYNIGESLKYGKYKVFSTLEAAQEYIILNNPCLSINDVAKVYKTANQFPVDKPNSQGNLLKELVKSKL
jgi:hypothetical protein